MIKDAQKYLDQNYPQNEVCQNESDLENQGKKRAEITNLDISNKELEGKLIIKDFPNLKNFRCGNNKNLTGIRIINLPKLNFFHANNCQLTNLVIENCPEVSYLNVANNLLINTNFLDI